MSGLWPVNRGYKKSRVRHTNIVCISDALVSLGAITVMVNQRQQAGGNSVMGVIVSNVMGSQADGNSLISCLYTHWLNA